jgi:hypothetical protein
LPVSPIKQIVMETIIGFLVGITILVIKLVARKMDDSAQTPVKEVFPRVTPVEEEPMPYSMEYDDVSVAEQFPKNVEIQQEHQQEFQQETQQEPQRPIDKVKDSTPAKKDVPRGTLQRAVIKKPFQNTFWSR